MNQYCIYLRKSRSDAEAEQRGEGETLARHEKALFELARRQKLNVVQVYREIVSGETIAARPVMQQLLTEVGEGIWTGVIVMEVERLARGDTVDQGLVMQSFKFSNTKIITPFKTYDPNNEFDEEYFEFGLFMSRREYKTINRRLQQGRIASIKEGKWLAMPPYGYRKLKLEKDKGYTLIPEPAEAEVVQYIFELYTKGDVAEDGKYKRLGFAAIATKLNQLNIPPSRHDYWMQSVIRTILKNPVYIGKVRWGQRPQKKKSVDGRVIVTRPINGKAKQEQRCGGLRPTAGCLTTAQDIVRDSGGNIVYDDYIIADGLHEPIIDKATFDLAQEFISDIPPMPVGYKKELRNPFAGLIYCQKCGRSMVYRKGAGKYNKNPYIVCHARGCDNISTPLRLIEERVLGGLQEWLDNYRLTWDSEIHDTAHQKESRIKLNAYKAMEKEIATLEKQLNKTYDLLEQGIYSTEEFLTRSRTIAANIEKAKQEYNELKTSLDKEILYCESRKAVIPKVEKLLDVYRKLETPADKNALLREVIEKMVYLKTVSGKADRALADSFTLDIYPKLPFNGSKS